MTFIETIQIEHKYKFRGKNIMASSVFVHRVEAMWFKVFFNPSVQLRHWAVTSFCVQFENRLESYEH